MNTEPKLDALLDNPHELIGLALARVFSLLRGERTAPNHVLAEMLDKLAVSERDRALVERLYASIEAWDAFDVKQENAAELRAELLARAKMLDQAEGIAREAIDRVGQLRHMLHALGEKLPTGETEAAE